jgi:hypothetical protein
MIVILLELCAVQLNAKCDFESPGSQMRIIMLCVLMALLSHYKVAEIVVCRKRG